MRSRNTGAKADVFPAVIDEREKRRLLDFDTPCTAETLCPHLLRFTSLHDRGRGISVPCDEAGNVDMDSLTLRLRKAYLGARAMVGRDYSRPTVQHLVALK